MNDKKILIITGGLSNEKDLSLISGEDITKELLKTGKNIPVLEITDDKRMILYFDAEHFLQRKSQLADAYIRTFNSIDFTLLKEYGYEIAFLALDGIFGEDGHVQAMLDLTDIAYTGSGVMASSIGMNKSKTYEIVSSFGVSVPDYFLVYKHDYDIKVVSQKIMESIGFPCVIKPNDSGSSIGVSSATTEDELVESLKEAFKHSLIAIVQKFIKGREFTCGVLGNTGYSSFEVLPVVESVIKDYAVFTHYQKYYDNLIEEICPAPIDNSLAKRLMDTSESVHKMLGCDGLSRCDFRYDAKDDVIYFLEINTLPGHTENSICPQEARSLGMSFGDFIMKQINLALEKKSLSQIRD